MGPKITIDSATLMNKGLEVIEAHWLFDVPPGADRRARPPAVGRALDGRDGRRIDHRAARGDRHAAAHPVRVLLPRAVGGGAAAARPRPGAAGWSSKRRTRRVSRAFALAFRALEGDPGLPVVLNAANEVAVAAFLDGRLRFTAIPWRDRRARWMRTSGTAPPGSVIWMTCVPSTAGRAGSRTHGCRGLQ